MAMNRVGLSFCLAAQSASAWGVSDFLNHGKELAKKMTDHACLSSDCGKYQEGRVCQCNAECHEHGNCCATYKSVCENEALKQAQETLGGLTDQLKAKQEGLSGLHDQLKDKVSGLQDQFKEGASKQLDALS